MFLSKRCPNYEEELKNFHETFSNKLLMAAPNDNDRYSKRNLARIEGFDKKTKQ